ncbi:MAG TPA: transcription-repair coupling factor [Catalimonadaceae bacterium]|jgi:transcription-repair coupling factor (superfamily II helicase)|nr:transcription-repair coupling factor [Catalimonadaceae bacterium]
MKIRDFVQFYQSEPLVRMVSEKLHKEKSKTIFAKGLSGSMDAVLAAALYYENRSSHLYILSDKEEAAYFADDLQQLLEKETQVLFFPSSYKKAYHYEEIDNANVLQRAEVLSAITQADKQGGNTLIVSYGEALAEKVINRKSLISNSWTIRIGEKLDFDSLHELMHEFEFEKTDFVFEPGQFAIRGFIVDIFSYASEHPIRIELLDDEIESIRFVHPETQLSIQKLEVANILPNVQSKMLQEMRESFLAFVPKNTTLWFKDLAYSQASIQKVYNQVSVEFENLISAIGAKGLITNPSELYDDGDYFSELIKSFQKVFFGKVAPKQAEQIEFSTKPQPSFNKDFSLLGNTLAQFEQMGYQTLLCADSPKQLERLQTIFDEINHGVQFTSLYLNLREGFEDRISKLICYTDHQIFERFHRFKGKEKFSKSKAITLRELKSLQPGDFVTHIDFGIGRFAGLEKIEVAGRQQEAVRLVYRDNDYLFVSIHSLHKISKYSGKEGEPPSISKLGSEEWENKKKKVKRKVKDIAKDLINLYAKRRAAKGFAFSRDTYMQVELESSFIYEDTPDQAKATNDVKNDMEKSHPMDRLVCGDVGFGKTEVAIRAAFKAVSDSKQVAVLVPTTILAMQHYKTFRERLSKFPCNVEYINRFKSASEVTKTLERVKNGEIDILIGTHMLLSKRVEFKDLGLMIVDEEQKFGVKAKEKLKEIKVNVDNLTLTATPIPRTLQHSLMGSRDLSIIATPPPNRQPVTTEVHTFSETIMRDSIRFELQRGGQVFFIHNRIGDLDQLANTILKLVPDAKVAIAHGQMEGSKLEDVMLKFIDGDYDVLVSTNIVESGLDIPNANTIIINQAHMFGLSDVHQMRGRVGRSNRKAYCYLFTPPTNLLTSDARKRLHTLEEFSDLGDGFKVAMRDLDIRGAGDLLGAEQSGFITDLGFEAYHKILDEAIQELKETEFKSLFENELSIKPVLEDCVIETDLELLIPESYVGNITERLSLYTQLDEFKTREQLDEFERNLSDRFGAIPKPVRQLMRSVELRWLAVELGFEKLILKDNNLRGYFISKPDSTFYQSEAFGAVLEFVKTNQGQCVLKEVGQKLMLKFEGVKSIEKAIEHLGSVKGNNINQLG